LLLAIPQLEGQGFKELLDKVRQTGIPYHSCESPATLMRNGKKEVLYLDFIYQPYYDNATHKIAEGVIGIAYEVTEQVWARSKVAEVVERLNFRNALLEQLPMEYSLSTQRGICYCKINVLPKSETCPRRSS
jgi:hypothetical protein